MSSRYGSLLNAALACISAFTYELPGAPLWVVPFWWCMVGHGAKNSRQHRALTMLDTVHPLLPVTTRVADAWFLLGNAALL